MRIERIRSNASTDCADNHIVRYDRADMALYRVIDKSSSREGEYHRFQDLVAQLTTLNEQICRSRSAESDETGWTEAEKKRLLQFIKKSHGKSRRFSS